jgi:hypothetical protein
LLLVLFAAAASDSVQAKDTEEKLGTRIQRERDPVKKAKLEIRLGRLKLLQAFEAFDHKQVEQSHELLVAYLERMEGAWKTLADSGRQASRKPQGFKELDIALREDIRLLEDFAHRVPFQVREPVEKTSKRVEELREHVLRALFPPVPVRRKEKAAPRQTLR